MLLPQTLILNLVTVVVSASSNAPSLERSVSAIGGYAVQTVPCPAGASQCGSYWCCPSALTCSIQNGTTIDNICCNGETDCFNEVAAAPVCADSSWELWLGKIMAPYDGQPGAVATNGEFCCLPGQVGTFDGQCVGELAGVQAASSLVPSTAPATLGTSTPTQSASSTKTSSAESGTKTGGSGSGTGSSTASTSESTSTASTSASSSSSTSHSGSTSFSSNSMFGIAVSITCSLLGFLFVI